MKHTHTDTHTQPLTFADQVSGLLFAEGGGGAGMEVVNWQFLKERCVRGE